MPVIMYAWQYGERGYRGASTVSDTHVLLCARRKCVKCRSSQLGSKLRVAAAPLDVHCVAAQLASHWACASVRLSLGGMTIRKVATRFALLQMQASTCTGGRLQTPRHVGPAAPPAAAAAAVYHRQILHQTIHTGHLEALAEHVQWGFPDMLCRSTCKLLSCTAAAQPAVRTGGMAS